MTMSSTLPRVTNKQARLLTVRDVAVHLGVSESSVTAYKATGRMPEPDQTYGRTPLWKQSTIDRWNKARPGRGRHGPRRKDHLESCARTGEIGRGKACEACGAKGPEA